MKGLLPNDTKAEGVATAHVAEEKLGVVAVGNTEAVRFSCLSGC